MKMPWTLELGILEMPSDFASRLSVRNCRDDLCGFCRDFGLDRQGLLDGRENAVAQLACLAGADVHAIMREAFVRIGQQRRYLHKGQEFIAYNLSRDRVRICPACVEEDLDRHSFRPSARPHRRSTWLIEYLRTCPHHAMALTAIGTGSEMATRHDTSTVLAAALSEIGSLVRAVAKRKPSTFETYVMERLEGTAAPLPWVDALPMHAVMRLSAMVGGAEIRGPQMAIDSFSNAERWEAEAVGFDILAGGEERIFAFLDRLQSSFLDGHVRFGPHPLFGHLYEWLAHQTDDPAYDPMRDLMWRHAAATLPIGPGDKLFGRDVPSRKLHSIRSASQQHGLHPKRTRKLLCEAGLIGLAADRFADDRVVVDAAAADGLLCGMAETMSQAVAARYLSIRRVQFMSLVRAGVIRPWITGARRERNHVFRKVDLDAFRDTLRHAADADLVPAENCADVLTAARRCCCPVAEILRLIADGRLRTVGLRDGIKGLEALMVDVEEVLRLVIGMDHGGLTLREVEKGLRTSTRVVKRLIEEGLLPIERVRNPVQGQHQSVVKPAALTMFRESYVSLHALARERGKGHLRLKSELAEAGVLPVGNPASLHITLYRRSDLG